MKTEIEVINRTAHVFIVDTNTFKYHLEYCFVGTGAKNLKIDFTGSKDSEINFRNLSSREELTLVELIADSQRIRKGDFIFFYLQQNLRAGVDEGRFYGVFKAKHDLSFYEDSYLQNELKKTLILRALIEPFEIYPKGVTEWEALDNIRDIKAPYQILWTLIYRKLKGNRGNTMITIYEANRLYNLIKSKNEGQTLSINNCGLTFKFGENIIEKDNTNRKYEGNTEREINILPRLIERYHNNLHFEPHLQAYIVQNIGRNKVPSLDQSLLGSYENAELEWIGNEIYCGVGMRKIDIMLSVKKKDKSTRILIPIEIKTSSLKEDHTLQMQKYIEWIKQYYLPNRQSIVQPVIICKRSRRITNTNVLKKAINQLTEENSEKGTEILPLKIIEFYLENKNLVFRQKEI